MPRQLTPLRLGCLPATPWDLDPGASLELGAWDLELLPSPAGFVISPRMKLGIINSAFHQVGIDTATGFQHIARIGFDCVDVFTEAVGISKKEIGLVARASEKLNLPI